MSPTESSESGIYSITNTINGKGGTGFIQKRGNANDTITNAANYTKALR